MIVGGHVKSDQQGQMVPVHTIVNATQIAAALQSAAAANTKVKKANSRLIKQQEQAIIKSVRKAFWPKYVARRQSEFGKKHPITYDEYIGEELSDDDVLIPARYKGRLYVLFPRSFVEEWC